ncbi:endospore germination permease [Paenibacillus sp. PAMC21692]|uniref:GerAB/ArcD/ProY family transporter n=1 Tax=Paenibacillus sp. PAMC21692 TaxID=2762320 RepID=UPI00164D49D8|nr:endospore germination permease [Paenibacillus sp. PAMC21692]QNK57309.1 endospore germination permease [Paenibacillus sp. PAMC21692]
MSKVRISPLQFGALIIMFVISSSTLLLPTILAAQARQDAWISAVAGVSISMLLVMIYGKLGLHCPDQTLAEMCESLLGKIAGKAAMLLFLIYLFIITAGLLSQVGMLASSPFLTLTPAPVVNIFFLAIIVFAVLLGLETFARAAQLFLPFILLLILLLIGSLMPLVQGHYLLPMLEYGPGPVIKGAITVVGVPFLDLAILLMVFPSVDDNRSAYKMFFGATAIGGLLLILVILFSTLVLGPYLTSIAEYPFFTLAQKVNIGNFVQRIESIVLTIWMVSMFFKITICYYALLLSAGQILQLRSYKPLALPVSLIIIILSISLFPSSVSFWEYVGDEWTPSVFLYGFVIPAVLLLVAAAKKKRGKMPAADKG